MKRVFITGANRGIGLEFVRQLLERGDQVFAGVRNPDAATSLRRLSAQHHDQVIPVRIDVTDTGSIKAARSAVSIHTNALDWLINNAGILQRGERLGEFDAAMFNRTFQVNVTGPALVTQAFVDLLRAGEQPLLVNMTSQLGSLARKSSASTHSYSASKAALNMLTRTLTYELKPMGITTVMMHPGWVQTDMGGDNANLTASEAVAGMLNVLDRLTPADTGSFLQYDGQRLPW
ncbi:MAG: SDR family oxidoreductase [Anaerolineae bacterium]